MNEFLITLLKIPLELFYNNNLEMLNLGLNLSFIIGTIFSVLLFILTIKMFRKPFYIIFYLLITLFVYIGSFIFAPYLIQNIPYLNKISQQKEFNLIKINVPKLKLSYK